MCTLVFGWKVFPQVPIVVAANRDERLDRDSAPPSVTGEDPSILAPRDEQAGGTWMGVNDHRLFVGITNRWLDADIEPSRSRGLLVDDVLHAATAAEGVRLVEESVGENTYDGFNLLVADRHEAHFLPYDGTLEVTQFDPGVHVIVNTGADGDYTMPSHREDVARTQGANADRVRAEMHPEDGEMAEQWLTRGKSVLGDHDFGVCIHGDGYGTVSTSLISIAEDGGVAYRYADGPPCRTKATVVDNHI